MNLGYEVSPSVSEYVWMGQTTYSDETCVELAPEGRDRGPEASNRLPVADAPGKVCWAYLGCALKSRHTFIGYLDPG